MIDTISSFLWMREGSDQIALLHGEGFCKPRGKPPTIYDLRYHYGSPWIDAMVNVVKTTVTVYYLHGAMKKAREIVFFKTKFTHLSADSNSFLLQRRPDYTMLQLLRGNAHPLR